MPDEFVGWIPNLTGYLSFSLIGKTKEPEPCFPENEGLLRNNLFVFRHRFNSDSAIPFVRAFRGSGWTRNLHVKLTDLWDRRVAAMLGESPRDKCFWFALVGSIQSDNCITGQILVFQRLDVSVRGLNVAETVEAVRRLENARTVARGAVDPREVENAIVDCGQLRAVARIDFVLARNGVVQLRPDVIVASEAADRRAKDSERFAQLAFFFFRDITHNHYHHSKTTDSVITAWPDRHDDAWLMDAFRSLMRKVHLLRRIGGKDALHDAIGFLAYARAFDGLARRRSAAYREFNKDFRFTPLERSINASIGNARDPLTEIRHWQAIMAAITIGALAIVLATVQIVPLAGVPPAELLGFDLAALADVTDIGPVCNGGSCVAGSLRLTTWVILRHPVWIAIYLAGCIGAIVSLPRIYVGRSFARRAFSSGWLRDLTRLAISLKTRVQGAALFVFFAMLLLISALLIFWMSIRLAGAG